jgi:hypothetical protein
LKNYRYYAIIALELTVMSSPNFPENGTLDQQRRAVDAVFSIGNPELSNEFVNGGVRTFRWLRSEDDLVVADLAGWRPFEVHEPEKEFGLLKIPSGTRSAATLLGGLEAWEGEKVDVVRFIDEYQAKVKKLTGQIDIGVGFDTVAITKDRQLFITPPHVLSSAESDMGLWIRGSLEDLSQILVDDPNISEIVEEFEKGAHDVLRGDA